MKKIPKYPLHTHDIHESFIKLEEKECSQKMGTTL